MPEPFSPLDTPWKLHNQLGRWLIYPYLRALFALHGVAWGPGWKLYGAPLLLKHRRSSISFGPGLSLRSTLRANPLGANHRVVVCTWQPGAVLQVGRDFAMTGGVLCAARSILIGDRVTVGANTTIIDTDFHPLKAAARQADPNAGAAACVVIEDDVFIGMSCLLLKGVRVGRGAVIGAGSVVTGDIPSGAIAAGNPARVVGLTEK